MTRLVRVRQHEDGLWYPEVLEGGKWVPRYKAPFWRAEGYKTRGSAAQYFGTEAFKPHTLSDGKTFPPRYEWAPGEEYTPKKRKPKVEAQPREPEPTPDDEMRAAVAVAEVLCLRRFGLKYMKYIRKEGHLHLLLTLQNAYLIELCDENDMEGQMNAVKAYMKDNGMLKDWIR